MNFFSFSNIYFRNISFILITLIFMLAVSPFIQWLEFFLLDLKFVFISSWNKIDEISDHIALINIDDKSCDYYKIPYGSNWRQYHPELINILTKAEVRLIVFDMEFYNKEKKWDTLLFNSFKEAGNVIAGEITEGATTITIRESLFAIGNMNVKVYWGIPRRINVYPENSNQIAISVEIFNSDKRLNSFKNDIDSKKNPFQQAYKNQKDFWINFIYPVNYFPVYSYIDVLTSKNSRINDKAKTPLSIFKNKIIIIGQNIERHSLPNQFWEKNIGSYLHAYAVENLIQNKLLKKISTIIIILILLIALIVFQLVQLLSRKLLRIILIHGFSFRI